MNVRRGLFAAALLAAVAVPSPGRAQTGNSRVFGELLKRIPEQSNTLMLVNVDGLFDSPMGRRENWRQKALEGRRAASGSPPTSRRSPSPSAWTSTRCRSGGRSAWSSSAATSRSSSRPWPPGGRVRRDDREHPGRLDPARVLPVRLPRQPPRVRLADRTQGPRRVVPVGALQAAELPPRVRRPGDLPRRRRRPGRARLRPGRLRLAEVTRYETGKPETAEAVRIVTEYLAENQVDPRLQVAVAGARLHLRGHLVLRVGTRVARPRGR